MSTSPDDAAPATIQDLRETIDSLVRGDGSTFDSVLSVHGTPRLVPNTRCSIRAHYVRGDANGRPRVQALSRQLAKQIVKFCIPRSAIAAARRLPDDARDEEITRLTFEAQRLFTTGQPNTGEGGELLLYTLLEHHLGIPQIMSKMSLKTNTNVQVHGTDGLHAHITEEGILALYWGEAKIYDDLGGALTSCFHSVGPFLRQEGAERQDVYLMQHYADTGNPRLDRALVDYFDDDLEKAADVELRAGCLVGFPLEQYPQMPDKDGRHTEILDAHLMDWSARVGRRLGNQGLQTFQIELFVIPLPSAEDFRAEMKKALNR